MTGKGEGSWDLDVTPAVITIWTLTPLANVEGNKLCSGGLALIPGRCGSKL